MLKFIIAILLGLGVFVLVRSKDALINKATGNINDLLEKMFEELDRVESEYP